jgi:hypothetical protein
MKVSQSINRLELGLYILSNRVHQVGLWAHWFKVYEGPV